MAAENQTLICEECGASSYTVKSGVAERFGCSSDECSPDEIPVLNYECLACGHEWTEEDIEDNY
jgi:hypothetical protein